MKPVRSIMKEVHPYISEGFGEDFVPENYDMSMIDQFELGD